MTDGHPTDGHLTDEELSSHLDGVVDASLTGTVASSRGDHLAGCGPCRRRLATLGSVRTRLRAPVEPVNPYVRAASIEAVLATVGDGRRTGIGESAAPSPVPSQHPNPAPSQLPGPAPVRISRRRPEVLVGAVAAVLVLAVAVGVPLALVGQSSSSQSRASSVTSQANRKPAGDHGAQGSAAAGPTGSVTAPVSDLGALSSSNRLRSQIMAAAQDEYSTAGPTTQQNQERPPSANATATTGNGNGLSNAGLQSGTTPAQFERCLSSAMDAAGLTRTLRLLATATFKGTPALVYLFGPEPTTSATGNPSRSAVVATARASCKVLATTYF